MIQECHLDVANIINCVLLRIFKVWESLEIPQNLPLSHWEQICSTQIQVLNANGVYNFFITLLAWIYLHVFEYKKSLLDFVF